MLKSFFKCCIFLFLTDAAYANEKVIVACASNFSKTLNHLIRSYTEAHDVPINASFASTGKLYAQINNGAPFDIFLAADDRRPKLLETAGKIIPNSRRGYALGRIALWGKNAIAPNIDTLKNRNFRHLAIANPRFAPYGVAAKQLFTTLNLDLSNHLVYGENINQVFHFVSSGSADLGLVAKSQLLSDAHKNNAWLVPAELHKPIEQQMVLLSKKKQARRFYRFLSSDIAVKIIEKHGYDIPAVKPLENLF